MKNRYSGVSKLPCLWLQAIIKKNPSNNTIDFNNNLFPRHETLSHCFQNCLFHAHVILVLGCSPRTGQAELVQFELFLVVRVISFQTKDAPHPSHLHENDLFVNLLL